MDVATWTVSDGLLMNPKADPGLNVYSKEWLDSHATSPSTKLHTNYIVQLIAREQARTVLDIGCASGQLVGELTRRGYEATGIDIVGDAVEYARKHNLGLFWNDMDVLVKYKFKYDVVILSHVLEHLETPVSYLRLIKELINPEGSLIVVVPNLKSYDEQSLWRPSRGYVLFDENHRIAFSPHTLIKTVEKAGFKDNKIYTHTYQGDILGGLVGTVGRKLLTNKNPAPGDEPLVTKNAADALTRLYTMIPSAYLDRRSEKSMRGSDLVVVAR